MSKKTINNSKQVLEHWNDKDIESMYDKHLLNLEINAISKYINIDSKILDVGCGEGEGICSYAKLTSNQVVGIDYSKVRLKKAKHHTKEISNIQFKQVDMLGKVNLEKDFDIIISQRFLINLMSWSNQKKVIHKLCSCLKNDGLLILLEGYSEGSDRLNELRKLFNLIPMPIRWHNFYINDNKLKSFMRNQRFKLIDEFSFSTYFTLTRVIRPYFETKLNWDSKFNKIAANHKCSSLLNISQDISRLKLWVFQKTR